MAVGVRLMPWGHGQGGREGKAKVLVVRLRWPWECGKGPGGTDKAAVGCGLCLAGAAKVAVGARPRFWRPGQGDRGGAAKSLGAQTRRPWRCTQGPEGDAKAALGMRKRP